MAREKSESKRMTSALRGNWEYAYKIFVAFIVIANTRFMNFTPAPQQIHQIQRAITCFAHKMSNVFSHDLLS